uniref:Uncharacterized protein n=1 Tax=Glossina brevipalpis TaxID=37001 RepID=A0A1A9WQ36_9MUSC
MAELLSITERIHPLLQAYDAPSQYLFADLIKSRLKGKATEAIEINCQAQSWVEIKNVLVNNFDTGATQSIVNPGLGTPKWGKKSKPEIPKTLQNNIRTTTIYQVPLFAEIGNPHQKMELIECKFHDLYDGILGNDVLKKNGGVIDFRNDELIINDRHIPLLYNRKQLVKPTINVSSNQATNKKDYCDLFVTNIRKHTSKRALYYK